MYTGLLHSHRLFVILFLLLYLVKGGLLLLNRKEALEKVTKITRIPEMVISALFLLTGIVMLFQIAEISGLLIGKILLVLAAIPLAIIGFRKDTKWMAALSVVILILVYGLAEMNKVGASKTPLAETVITDAGAANYNALAHGQALYNRNCVVCHGEDGKGKASGAKDLTVTELSDDAIKNLLLNGKNAMPSYKKIYSETEIGAVIEYVKTFR